MESHTKIEERLSVIVAIHKRRAPSARLAWRLGRSNFIRGRWNDTEKRRKEFLTWFVSLGAVLARRQGI